MAAGLRTPRLPSLMHSTHCWPTGAGRRPDIHGLACGFRHAVGPLDLDGLQHDVLRRPVPAVGRRVADLVHDLLALDDLTEDGVPAVQVRGRDGRDEELR